MLPFTTLTHSSIFLTDPSPQPGLRDYFDPSRRRADRQDRPGQGDTTGDTTTKMLKYVNQQFLQPEKRTYQLFLIYFFSWI